MGTFRKWICRFVLRTSLLTTAATTFAQLPTTTVSFDSSDEQIFDQNNIPLTAGGPGDGNGAVLQLGYYSTATTANNFSGTWIPLSGETSLNTALIPGSSPPEMYNQTSIGDLTINFAGAATFAIQLSFRSGDPTSGNSLPSSTTIPLALRFYNNISIASSTHYNVVSDDNWLWVAPNTPPATRTMQLTDLGLEWLSIAQGQAANTAFHTSIPLAAIPEPATVATGLLASASLAFAAFRRRRRIS